MIIKNNNIAKTMAKTIAKTMAKTMAKTKKSNTKTNIPVTNAHEQNIVLLQRKIAWYESFFMNASDALFIIQPDTWNVLDANEYAAYLFEMKLDDLIGSSVPQFRRIFKLLDRGSPKILSDLSLINSNGKEIIVEISARFIRIDDELLIQAIARDISEQHALNDKLVQENKLALLGRLSMQVAHDIRNPLAAVSLNLQLLKRNTPQDSPEHNFIDVALQGVERIHRIVEVSLNFSKQTVMEVSKLNLNSLIPTVLELTDSSIKRKDITVALEFANNLAEVSADAKQLQQVFVNLITNATDAIKNTGTLTIKTYNEKSQKNYQNNKNERDFAVVAISDTGCGISEDDLPKIFEEFFTRKPDGTGLGLPIIQRILHQHNGVIDVESTVDIGTTFYVKLPVINEM